MKRFEFKLQPLLNYRKYLERLAQQKTAKAHMDVTNCEKQIVQLKLSYEQIAQEIEDIMVNGVSASEFKRYHSFLDSVESTIDDETNKKIQLKKILNEKLLALKKKSIDKKAMELYREKLKIKYIQEGIKIDQKEQDEMSSLKTARTISHETL
ncbi:MAG: flagellar export protein FliJ [Proteobacteria bacterium]|nr:flagellar export protein FliJ [Pseudomonadota bacterium]MBU1584670.1 flagellar export protein FliJ [Pseudomonadota bacterium]MBU2631538.1 flagellar export protein FliJ [Pseudomonadota bacterium]